jgi:hypothetical protein
MKDAMSESAGEVRQVVDLPGDMAAIKRAFHSEQEPEWVVWLTVAAALIIGLIMMYVVTGRTTTATAGATTLSYPATWQQITEPGTQFAAADIANGFSFGSRLSVRQATKDDLAPAPITGQQPDEAAQLRTAANNWILQQQQNVVGYRSLNLTPTTVGNKQAITIEDAYLLDPALGGGSGLPALMHGQDTIVLSGDNFSILSFATQAADWDATQDVRAKLLSGWQVP